MEKKIIVLVFNELIPISIGSKKTCYFVFFPWISLMFAMIYLKKLKIKSLLMPNASFFLDKQKISLLYKYYLLGDLSWLEPAKEQVQTEKQKAQIAWFLNCWEKEKYLITQIESKLKTGWTFSRLPPLEKAVLIYAAYEIFFAKGVFIPSLLNQVVEFSKRYLENDKYKYINKILDLIYKSKMQKEVKKT
ncbi:MAG: transcription antitermination protein NusB [Mycoplasmataceae bacterium CE_OT135]|nr:MAG: transcription antitermination protein NusB [Mycoplasmataceae bacterium CE_OT135]